MNRHLYRAVSLRYGSALLCLALWALLSLRPALAVEVADVYTAEVGYDPAARNARDQAYAAALGEVLRRITPDTSRGDAALLFERPGDYVLGWREGAAGRLWVSFDGGALGRVLRDAGIPVWGSDRPLTLVWLAIEGRDGERRMLTRQQAMKAAQTPAPVTPPLADLSPAVAPHDFFADLETAARTRGIPLALPLYDEQDRAAVTDSDVWGGFDDVIRAASRRYGADSVLVGRASERDPQRIRWTWLFAGESTSFSGSAMAAVDRVSQSLIGQLASSPDASVDVRVSIVGVNGMSGYGTVLRYLRSQSLIGEVRVLAMRADQLLLEIDALVSRTRLSSLLDGDVLSRIEPPPRAAAPVYTATPPVIRPADPADPAPVAVPAAGPPDFADADLFFRVRPVAAPAR